MAVCQKSGKGMGAGVVGGGEEWGRRNKQVILENAVMEPTFACQLKIYELQRWRDDAVRKARATET